MSELEDSIVFISGTENNSFGTGFVFYKQDNYSYVLTCAHVLEQIGEIEIGISQKIKVEGVKENIEVVACGSIATIDLTVLKVLNLEKPVLKLMNLGRKGLEINIKGWSDFDAFKRISIKLDGTLATPATFTFDGSEHYKAWYLKIDTVEKEHGLEKGYSGSPVVLKEKNNIVVAVTSNQRLGKEQNKYDECERGYAISVSNLLKIWPEAPDELKKLITEKPPIDLTKTDCHLLILLQEGLEGLYKARAWIFYPLNNYKEIILNDEFIKLSKNDEIKSKELIIKLFEALDNNKEIKINHSKLTLEFILPTKLFFYHVEKWKNKLNKPIGIRYPVLIRSEERLRITDKEIKDFWKEIEPDCLEKTLLLDDKFWLEEPKEEKIPSKINKYGCLALRFDPSNLECNFFNSMFEYGIAIGLWACCCQDYSGMKKDINSLLNNVLLKDLPNTLLEFRQEQSGEDEKYHLTLFWDDKTIIPDELDNEQSVLKPKFLQAPT